MKTRHVFIPVLVLVLVASCRGPESQNDNAASDIAAINELLAEHVAAVHSGDVAANLAGFIDDMVYLPPDAPPVLGKSALMATIEPFYESFEGHIDMVPEETILNGDWAFQWGNGRGSFQPIGGGESMSVDLKYVYVYQRQTDGSWKIAWDIFNSNVAPPAPPVLED